jgi:hypothetical protein
MPKKPSRVRYSGVAPFIDDTQANRIQALGSSSRLTTEDMKELGTLNIVEVVDDVPQIDISIDQNENGTNDLVGLLSNTGYGCNVVALPDGAAVGSTSVKIRQGSYYANGNRVFFDGTTLAVASGNVAVYLNPVVSGGATAKVSCGSTVPAGSIPIATISASAITGGVITQADITDTRSFGTITHLNFELAKADVFVPIKQITSDATPARTMYIENAFVNSIDFNFGVGSPATANFRLESDNKRWFLNNASQLIVDEFKGPGVVTLTQIPTILANGKYLLKLVKNGDKLTENTDFTVNSTTKVVTFTVGLIAGDMIKVRYVSTLNGKFFSPVPASEDPHPEYAGGVKQGNIEVYLSDDLGSKLTRVQSVRLNVPLTRQPLGELGALAPFDRPMNLPINSSVTLEFKDSDLEVMSRLASKDLTTVNELSVLDMLKNKDLVIKIYRENDIARAKLAAGHPDKLAIKTIKVQRLIPQSENWDAKVDNDANQTFEFMAHNVSLSDIIG